MALGPKWLGVTLPVAAFLGSAVGVVAMRKLDAGANPTPAGPGVPALTSAAPPTPAPADGKEAVTPGPALEPLLPEPGEDVVANPTDCCELPIPPGYFDVVAPIKGDGTDPPVLKPGQVVQVEVLEALPGRPITGTRVIRPDGTISLGFYGDLRVAGLNRHQVKARLIEALRTYLTDQCLGMERAIDGRRELTPILENNRVLVDDSINFEPQATPLPTTRTGRFDPAAEGFQKQVEALTARVEQLIGGLASPGPPATPKMAGPPAPAPVPAVDASRPEPAPAEVGGKPSG